MIRHDVIEVDTSLGRGRWLLGQAADPAAWLLLGHGAGGGPEAPDLACLASSLPREGVSVARFEQPWRTAGRRVAPRPPVLDQGWLEAVPTLTEVVDGRLLVVGGRSAGARVACRTAGTLGAAGVVALAFPLHPPGRPDRSRGDELRRAGVPLLVVQGERDPFGGAAELRAVAASVPDLQVAEVSGAGHALRVPARQPGRAQAEAVLGAAVRDFLGRLVGTNAPE